MGSNVQAPPDGAGAADPARPAIPGTRRSGGAALRRRLLAVPTPIVFAVSVGIAFLLLWRQGSLADLADAARGADPAVLVLAVVLYLLGLAGLCLRWHALVRMVGGTSGIPLAAEAFLTSVVVNYAAPIGLAVPTRAALSKRDLGLSAGATGALALWEVALDVLVLGLISLVWLATGGLAPLRDAAGDDWATVLLIGAGALAVGAILATAAAVRWPRVRRLGVAALGVLRYPLGRPRPALAALGLTFGFWALQAVILRLLLGSVGLGGAAGPGLVIGLLGPPVLIGMLSPVPGGAGVREALMVAVAQAREVDGAAVLLAAVAYRAALFLTIPVLYMGVRLWRASSIRPARSRGGR